MNVQQIFDLGVKNAIQTDPRGKKGIEKYFKAIKQDYEDLSSSEKQYFDKTKLTNPYPDSMIHVNDERKEVKRVLAGIDIGGSEILLADQLGLHNKKIDLVISHHPNGRSFASLHEVMDMSTGVYESYGLPIHIAERIMDERVREVGRGLMPINHYKTIDIAKILKINLIDTHTITDNLVNKFFNDLFIKNKPETLGDIMSLIMDVPEFQIAKRNGMGPRILSGSSRNHVGKWIVEMTGGTNPSSKVYTEFSKVGFSTIISMHMKEDGFKIAQENHLNVIITGHMSSDSLGMNLFLDELEKQGIEIVPCGGLIRVSRVVKKISKS
jgi:putative NIF3 family GTP cyclohydrolase 1 type 2